MLGPTCIKFIAALWNYAIMYKIDKTITFNPLLPSAHKSVRIAKISIVKLEGTIKQFYERRDYVTPSNYTILSPPPRPGGPCVEGLLPAVYEAALVHSDLQHRHRHPLADQTTSAIIYVSVSAMSCICVVYPRVPECHVVYLRFRECFKLI